MSVFQEVLESLATYINEHEEFKDFNSLDWYYDITLLTANAEFPCMCYDVGYNDDNSELKTPNPLCRSYYREIDINLFTPTKDHNSLLAELWDYEEVMLKIINSPVNYQNVHPKLLNIKYVGTPPQKTIYHQAFRDDYEEEMVANSLSVRVELEYIL